jgi:hypothetical protein
MEVDRSQSMTGALLNKDKPLNLWLLLSNSQQANANTELLVNGKSINKCSDNSTLMLMELFLQLN